MCNGCQFLNISFNPKSFISDTETFDTCCLRFGVKGPCDITKDAIKCGVIIFPDCPSSLPPVNNTAEEFVTGCTDEFYD